MLSRNVAIRFCRAGFAGEGRCWCDCRGRFDWHAGAV